jgi:hypothetical protein
MEVIISAIITLETAMAMGASEGGSTKLTVWPGGGGNNGVTLKSGIWPLGGPPAPPALLGDDMAAIRGWLDNDFGDWGETRKGQVIGKAEALRTTRMVLATKQKKRRLQSGAGCLRMILEGGSFGGRTVVCSHFSMERPRESRVETDMAEKT